MQRQPVVAPLTYSPLPLPSGAAPAASLPIAVECAPPTGAAAPWFPTEHLFAGAAPATSGRELLAVLDEQARLLDTIMAARLAGAASLPAPLVAAIQAAVHALALARGELPV